VYDPRSGSMAAKSTTKGKEKAREPGSDWYSVHSQKSRLVIYSPEKDFYIYVVSRAVRLNSKELT